MNREDILSMAIAAGIVDRGVSVSDICMIMFERFAALVAAHEREECAKACESERVCDGIDEDRCFPEDLAYNNAIKHATAAIRARGQS